MHAASGIGFYFLHGVWAGAQLYRNYFDVYPFCSCVLQVIGVWLVPPLARLKTFDIVLSRELVGDPRPALELYLYV